MNEKVEITKIVVRIGDKQAELTLEQARELRDVLDGLLGKGGGNVYVYPVYPQVWPYYPQTWITSVSVGDDPGAFVTATSDTLARYISA